MANVRSAITEQLKEIGKSRYWLAKTSGVRLATVYDFLNGKASANVKIIDKLLTTAGLELTPKKKRSK